MSKPLQALGLMSGTSLDGIDVALLETDGDRVTKAGPAATYPYDPKQRHLLRAALDAATRLENRSDRPQPLAEAEQALTRWHIRAVESFLEENSLTHRNIDVIGFHGQTVIHRPERRLTVQLGLGQVMADELGVPVVYDMRANDVAEGGQGAPLVPVYHRALAAQLDYAPVAFVNIGGVANVTWVGADGEIVAFDTGPGNALIDDWMKRHTGVPRDESGSTALTGRANATIVDQVLGHEFFKRAAPKSLDRDSFSAIRLAGETVADGAATLVAITARSIAASSALFPAPPAVWVICGGGRHNAAIMQTLRELLERVVTAEDCGFNGDAMEAEAWAYLAVRSLRKLPLTFPTTTGVKTPMTGGVIANPKVRP